MNNWTVTQVVTFLRDAGFSDFRALAIALTQETKGDSKQLCSSPEAVSYYRYSFNSCGGLEERRGNADTLLSCSRKTFESIISELDDLGEEFTSKEFFDVTEYPMTTGYMVRRYLLSLGYLKRSGQVFRKSFPKNKISI